jgi:signal transduction histidine kinase
MQLMKLIELITTATDKLYQQFKVEYNFEGIRDNFNLSAFANVNLYRIFQELSNNALKHSNASKITITAIKDANTLQIKLIDDGVGFDGMENKDKGIGLMNIESRMIGLNGHFYIMSNINSGTTIHLIMNLKDIC